MLLLQKGTAPLCLGRQKPLTGRRLVTVRFQEETRTGSPRTQKPIDSPYYSGYNDDPAESLRAGWENLKAKWDNWDPEKRNQTLAWGGGGLLVLYLANGLLNQIDRLPILPQFLELVGFAFTSWFSFRYLLYADGREDLSRLSLDQLLGRAESAAEDATRDFGRAAFEGGEGIGEAGDRLRKSSVGRALSDDGSSGSSRLSDGSRTGYSGKEVKSNIKGALNDLDDVANDVAGR